MLETIQNKSESETFARPKHIALNEKTLSYREALFKAMDFALEQFPNTIIMGQGVDDHKGTFGTTLGLAKKYGAHRVMDTPLAEEGMTGIGIGAALNGLYPIQTHIRADFSLLAMNQIINLAAKFKYMFGGLFDVPMLVRLVIGRSWGQGAQHSQSLQSLFAHIPGLTVIMPSCSQTIVDSYSHIVSKHKGPVISLEHRLMYDLNFEVGKQPPEHAHNPLSSYVVRKGKDVTIVATSIMVLEAIRSAKFLSETKGIDCEIIDLHNISHPNFDLILESVKKTGKLIVADTSWKPFGVCAEVCRVICEKSPSSLKAPVMTLGMSPAPCPTAKSLEDIFYPSLHDFVDTIAQLVTGKKDHGITLPDEKSMADQYKKFKGPF